MVSVRSVIDAVKREAGNKQLVKVRLQGMVHRDAP